MNSQIWINLSNKEFEPRKYENPEYHDGAFKASDINDIKNIYWQYCFSQEEKSSISNSLMLENLEFVFWQRYHRDPVYNSSFESYKQQLLTRIALYKTLNQKDDSISYDEIESFYDESDKIELKLLELELNEKNMK